MPWLSCSAGQTRDSTRDWWELSEELGVRADHTLSVSQPGRAVTTNKQRFGMCKQQHPCETWEGAGCKGSTGTVLPAWRGAGEHGKSHRHSSTMASARGVCLGRMQHPQGQRDLTFLEAQREKHLSGMMCLGFITASHAFKDTPNF